MIKVGEIYKCDKCSNVVNVIQSGEGTLVCCGEDMKLMEAKTAAAEGKEKHVPVIEKTSSGFRVKVGSIPHPMEEKHFISMIEGLKGGIVVGCKFLKPGDAPEAEFKDIDEARAFCNLHGLWKS